MEIKAKLRRSDRDIKEAVSRLRLEEWERMSDLVRDGFRKELVARGVMETVDDIETAIERNRDCE